MPLAHKDLLVFEVLPASQVKQQALTAPTTTLCLSSAHPWLGKDEIPSPPLAHSCFLMVMEVHDTQSCAAVWHHK